LAPLARAPISRWWLTLAFVVGAGLRIHLALTDDGIYWPDEIYQSIEPAHRLVFGHGLIAWEFLEGARNWALPGLVAVVLKLLSWFNLTTPQVYLPVIKGLFAVLSTVTGWGVFRLSRQLGAREWPATVAATVWLFASPFIYFAPRAMSENASAAPLVFAFAWLLKPDASKRQLILSGSLLGLATLLRLQNGFFAAGALLILIAHRRWRAVPVVALTLSAWALAYGALDAATWNSAPQVRFGGWFHSAFVYLRFNVIENKASQFGTAEFGYYGSRLAHLLPLGLGPLVLLGTSKNRAFGAVCIGFFVLLSSVPHKELRFVLPVMPLLLGLALAGFSVVAPSRLEQAALVYLTLSAMWSAVHHRQLTFGDIGAYPQRSVVSAYDDFGALNRLLLTLSTRDDACGVRIDVTHLAWSGGSSYLHRSARIYPPSEPANSRHFNYAITWPGSGAEVIARQPGLELVRVSSGCADDASFRWHLD
jgi:GPI mannosyltransferase 3